MINIIKFLQDNLNVLELVKEKKVSLVGVTENELEAILEAYEQEIAYENSKYWQ